MPAFLLSRKSGADVAYSQQGITTSSQQSLSQQGEAAKAATEASAKARTVKSFFIWVLKVEKLVIRKSCWMIVNEIHQMLRRLTRFDSASALSRRSL